MNTSFISSLIEKLKDSKANWDEIIMVFPNKRSQRMFKKAFLQKKIKHQNHPKTISINDLILSITQLNIAPSLIIQNELYKSYAKVTNENKDNYENFLSWSNTLIEDFNKIDQNLLSHSDFFSYLSSLHKLRSTFEEENSIIKRYDKFWSNLSEVYASFSNSLKKRKLSTKGMCYRAATKKLDIYKNEHKKKSFVFCGFNALSKSEEKIILSLLEHNNSKIFWDIDKEFLKENFNKTGFFIKKYLKTWEYFKTTPSNFIHSEFLSEKNINEVECNLQYGQVKELGYILENMNYDNISKTAIIVSDESIINSILNSIPEKVKDFNVSVGIKIDEHSITRLIIDYLNAHLKKSNYGFYAPDIQNILDTDYFNELSKDFRGQLSKKIINNIIDENRSFFKTSYIVNHAIENSKNFIKSIFDDKIKTNEVFKNISKMLLSLKMNKPKRTDVEIEVIDYLLKAANEIEDTISNLKINPTYRLLITLLKQNIRDKKIYLQNQPENCLQILGLLETRALDFKNIIFLSLNEGIMPPQNWNSSWIPYDVKKEFELPTQDEQDALYTYHFFRLMFRAKNIHLLYNGVSDGIQYAEKSRFVRQWKFYLPKKHKWIKKNQIISSQISEKKEIILSKTNEVLNKLKEISQSGLSATAINLFIKDSYGFYKKYLLGIKEDNEYEESFSYKTYGIIVHHVLENLYSPYVGKILSLRDLNLILKEIEPTVNSSIKKFFPQQLVGNNLLAKTSIIRNIENIIKSERKDVELGKKIKILGLEQKLYFRKKFDFLDFDVYFKGTIDRVDTFDNKLRILDYKTGAVEQSKITIHDWESISNNEAYSQVFQLLLYVALWNHNNPKNKANNAGIIGLKLKENPIYFGEKPTKSSRNIDFDISEKTIAKFHQTLEIIMKNFFDATIPYESKKE